VLEPHRLGMTRDPAPRSRPRLPLLLAVGLLAAVFAAPAPVAAADDLTVAQAELAMVDALNADRTAVGLVPLRTDSRLMSIARARSVDMATKGYFSHTQPDGRDVFDLIDAAKITWYYAGEIIALNNYPTLETSIQRANSDWLASPNHKALIVSTDFNYMGVGLAVNTKGVKYWTAVFLKGPDRTGARATTAAPTIAAGATPTTKKVTVSWTGADVQLQVLTSGFHSYQVQRRVDGGAWTTVWSSTTVRSMTLQLATNHTYEFRVAARDKAGNWGAWSTVKAALAAPTGAVVVSR
jgi:uncharacterized protein YkwD